MTKYKYLAASGGHLTYNQAVSESDEFYYYIILHYYTIISYIARYVYTYEPRNLFLWQKLPQCNRMTVTEKKHSYKRIKIEQVNKE